MFIFNFIWYDPIIYVHNILIDNQFNWRISPFVIHRRSWITRFLFLAKTMDHAKNSGFSKLWLLWRRSLAFFVRCGSVVLCIAVQWTLVYTLYLLIFSFFTGGQPANYLYKQFHFSQSSNQPKNIFNPLSDCNTEYITCTCRPICINTQLQYGIEKISRDAPPPLYSACEIKLLQYHNKIRLIVFVPAQISTDDLSIDNLKFFHCPFTKCMLKVFLNDWQK